VPDKLLGDAGNRALSLVEESNDFHDKLVSDCDQRWREFEGRMEWGSEAAQWQSKLHPPYLNHIVETQLAGLLDERFSFRVTPAPRLFNPGEQQAARLGAKAHELLFRQQLKQARFNEFQRPYALDAAVCGIGIAPTTWRSESGKRKRNVVVNAAPPELEQFGLFIPSIKTIERVEAYYDGPCTEAADPRDCYWHEGATSLEKSRFFAQAIWMTYADLMVEAKAGRYDMDAVRSLQGATEASADGVDGDRYRRGRRRDMIEVLWVWDREKHRCTVIGGRQALLRDKPWPFWHGQYPFTIVSLQPLPRALKGMSVVEKLAHLQEMTWDLMNQRIDNVRFINNFISILRSDVDDPGAYPFEPGAQWFLDDPASVQQWSPNPIPAEISLGAESILKQDMQNLAGGQPFTSTSEARGIGADTATEAALVTNLAQMATKQMKARLYEAYGQIGQQWLELNQQFIREPVYAELIGLDDEAEIQEILPHMLVGNYRFDIAPMNESLNRQERRSEANGRFQMFIQAAPALAALGVNLNYRALVEDVFDAWDEQDKDRYFSAQQPAAALAGQGAQQPAPELQPATGVTAPQSIDPATSPSTQASLSPAVFSARTGASQGGSNNL
jgi:hypothetical protein